MWISKLDWEKAKKIGKKQEVSKYKIYEQKREMTTILGLWKLYTLFWLMPAKYICLYFLLSFLAICLYKHTDEKFWKASVYVCI